MLNLRILRSVEHLKLMSPYYPTSAVISSRNLLKCDNTCCHIASRNVTTNSAGQFVKELFNNGKYKFQDVVRKAGILDFGRSRLRRNGYFIYDQVADNIDYKYFFAKFNLPDTFNSWFIVMELHIWMVLVRLMAEAEEGRFVRNMVIESMWEDIRQKTGLLGAENTSKARAQIKILSEEFQAALVGYDEGLLGDDIVLAGALWRRFFCRDCNNPELIETLIKYIRMHVKHFDMLTKEDVLLYRKFAFFPMDDKT